jgi:hypothetical protein
MLLFRSEEHVDNWCQQWNQPHGATLTLEQGWSLAQQWYGPDRRDPTWRRYSMDEAHAIFASLGLTSPFWNLTG